MEEKIYKDPNEIEIVAGVKTTDNVLVIGSAPNGFYDRMNGACNMLYHLDNVRDDDFESKFDKVIIFSCNEHADLQQDLLNSVYALKVGGLLTVRAHKVALQKTYKFLEKKFPNADIWNCFSDKGNVLVSNLRGLSWYKEITINGRC